MSICNVWIGERSALVTVDTAVIDKSGRRFHASKLMLLPHAMTALTVRGAVGFLSLAYAHLADACCDFDAMDAGMIELLNKLHAQLVATHPEVMRDFMCEIAMVGPSMRNVNELAGVTYQCAPGATAFVRLPIDRARIHGAPPEWTTMPDISSAAAMEAVARMQVEYFQRTQPDAAIGGRLLCAELTRDSFAIQTQCAL